MAELIDLTGRSFGMLTVIRRGEDETRNGHVRATWLCQCACGKHKTLKPSVLRGGNTRSCGCMYFKAFGESNTAAEYRCWVEMLRRCGDPRRKDYPRYGGRGITVCERWLHSYANFISDVGRKPSPSHSIDRKNNNLGYCPENCKWSTKTEQNDNRSNTIILNFGGEKLTVREISERTGVNPITLRWRLTHGWPTEKAVQPACSGASELVHA